MVETGSYSGSAALSVAGIVYEWGSYPLPVEGLDDVVSIALSDRNITALKEDGTVWQRSHDGYSAMTGLSDIVSISSSDHSLALDEGGQIWAWGYNRYGQLGNGSDESSSTPVKVDFGVSYDDAAPQVVSTSPADNDSEVALNTTITVTFNEPVKSGASFSSIRLIDEKGNLVSLIQKGITDNILTLKPLSELNIAMEYTVIIPADAILDLSNNALGIEYRFSFVAGSTILVSGVNFEQEQFFLALDGPSAALKAIITPANASNKNLCWFSSNSEVATVNAEGLVTPKTVGSAKITVTTEDGNFSDSCSVSVGHWVAVEGVYLDKEVLNLGLGEKARLQATIMPNGVSNQKLYWSSSDTGVAKVDSDGKVEAVFPLMKSHRLLMLSVLLLITFLMPALSLV